MKMTEIEKLKKENDLLKRKLAIAKAWMERWVKNQVNAISKRKINKMTAHAKDYFLKENIEEIISKKINDFFGDIMLMNILRWDSEKSIRTQDEIRAQEVGHLWRRTASAVWRS